MANRPFLYSYLDNHANDPVVAKWDQAGLLLETQGYDRIELANYFEEVVQYITQRGWDQDEFLTYALPVTYRAFRSLNSQLNIDDLLTKLRAFMEPDHLKLFASTLEKHIEITDLEAQALQFFIRHYTEDFFNFKRLKKIEL